MFPQDALMFSLYSFCSFFKIFLNTFFDERARADCPSKFNTDTFWILSPPKRNQHPQNKKKICSQGKFNACAIDFFFHSTFPMNDLAFGLHSFRLHNSML